MLRDTHSMASPSTGVLARRVVLAASGALLLFGLVRIGRTFFVDGELRFGNPVGVKEAQPVAHENAAIAIRAEVVRVVEGQVVRAGDKCEFLVERRQQTDTSVYCNAQIVCGGKVLYGGPERGYFACRIFEGPGRDVIGADPSTTRQDQDAAMRLDTREGVLRVWDDEKGALGAFSIEAEVLSAL